MRSDKKPKRSMILQTRALSFLENALYRSSGYVQDGGLAAQLMSIEWNKLARQISFHELLLKLISPKMKELLRSSFPSCTRSRRHMMFLIISKSKIVCLAIWIAIVTKLYDNVPELSRMIL